jgi:predicted nucleotide-binding protein (sugar kinase/HSP70/actin superfamily)
VSPFFRANHSANKEYVMKSPNPCPAQRPENADAIRTFIDQVAPLVAQLREDVQELLDVLKEDEPKEMIDGN